jgi:hypothetical protein
VQLVLKDVVLIGFNIGDRRSYGVVIDTTGLMLTPQAAQVLRRPGWEMGNELSLRKSELFTGPEGAQTRQHCRYVFVAPAKTGSRLPESFASHSRGPDGRLAENMFCNGPVHPVAFCWTQT